MKKEKGTQREDDESGGGGNKKKIRGFDVHYLYEEKLGEDEIAQITKSVGSTESLVDEEIKNCLCFYD